MDKNNDESEETLEERRSEILSEIDANNESGEDIISLVSECGSMSDVDKLTVHIKEVESVTNLLIVLRERLDRIEEELSQKSGNDAEVGFCFQYNFICEKRKSMILKLSSC